MDIHQSSSSTHSSIVLLNAVPTHWTSVYTGRWKVSLWVWVFSCSLDATIDLQKIISPTGFRGEVTQHGYHLPQWNVEMEISKRSEFWSKRWNVSWKMSLVRRRVSLDRFCDYMLLDIFNLSLRWIILTRSGESFGAWVPQNLQATTLLVRKISKCVLQARIKKIDTLVVP